MSDLAPFVAAALRDKVVQDLMEENKSIRQQLKYCRLVEITGPSGDPVYARAQLDDDGDYHGNPNLWSVKFPKKGLSCPLTEMEGIEIWVGGVLKAKFAENDYFETFLDLREDDHAMGKETAFCFSGSSSLWLNVMIDGWPEEHWRATMREANTMAPDSLLQYLVETVATEAPLGKIVTFLEVAFMCDGVRGAIASLNRPPPTSTWIGEDSDEDIDEDIDEDNDEDIEED